MNSMDNSHQTGSAGKCALKWMDNFIFTYDFHYDAWDYIFFREKIFACMDLIAFYRWNLCFALAM